MWKNNDNDEIKSRLNLGFCSIQNLLLPCELVKYTKPLVIWDPSIQSSYATGALQWKAK
jgi:hypothetical protein